MEIIIDKNPEDLNIDDSIVNDIKNAIEVISKLYEVEENEVSLTLTNDETIHKLNKEYRGIDRATDVLSFAFREADEPGVINTKADILGDIIISIERAKSQAEEYGHSLRREVVFLTVHGMLHLLGYDHIEEADRIEMEQEQTFIMDKLGIGRS